MLRSRHGRGWGTGPVAVVGAGAIVGGISALSLVQQACTYELVEPQPLSAGAVSSSGVGGGAGGGTGGGGSGGGGGAVDDHALCIFGGGDRAAQSVNDLATNPGGDFAFAGVFKGSIDFGGTTQTNPNGSFTAGFIAKLDERCQVLWSSSFVASAGAEVTSVAVDGERSIAAGWFQGDATFGDEQATTLDQDAFVAGFDSGGNVQRFLQLGGTSTQSVGAVAAAGPTAWVLVGKFNEELWWGAPAPDGGAPLATSSDAVGDVFVLEIEEVAAGFQPKWARAYGDPGKPGDYRFVNGVAVDAAGNIALAGYFKGSLDFGDACSPIVSAAKEDMFVAKLDAQGNCLWARGYGSEEDDRAEAVAFDSAGDVSFTGSFKLDVDFGKGTLEAPPVGAVPNHNAVLVKLAGGDGATLWSLGFGDSGEQHGWDVAVGADDAVYVTLGFEGHAVFDPAHDAGVVDSSSLDILVASFDGDGQFRWVRRYGDTADQTAHRVGVDGRGTVTLAGNFSGTLATNVGTVVGDSLGDVFAMRIGP